MSDILIRGMEMPKEGSWVTLRVFSDGQCVLHSWCGNDDEIKFEFMEHLTAVPVPPHVRPVVLCGACELHGHCYTEDVFAFALLAEENRFCAVGKVKTDGKKREGE